MTPDPDDFADDYPYEADLGMVTNETWLAGHERLADIVAAMPDFPDEELTFIWDPDLDPATLIDRDEVDHSPARRYDAGGLLRPGLSTALNDSGEPKEVIPGGSS